MKKKSLGIIILLMVVSFFVFGIQVKSVKAASKPTKTKITSIQSHDSKVYLKWKKNQKDYRISDLS